MSQPSSIVLDIGVQYTKVGYSGTLTPLHVIPTRLYYNNQLITHTSHCTQLSFKQWYIVLLTYCKYLYYDVLQCTAATTQQHPPALVILHYDYTDSFKYALLSVLHHMNVQAICCIDSSVCNTIGSGYNNALIIDIGYSNTRIMPVYHDTTVIPSFQLLDIGIQHCIGMLIELVTINRSDKDKQCIVDELMSDNNVENILLQHCYLPSAYYTSDTDDRVIHLSNNIDIMLTNEIRSSVCNIFYGNNLNGINIVESLLDALLLCDIHVRGHCTQNIVLCGGGSIINNFIHSIREQINHMLTHNVRYTSIQHLTGRLHINNNLPVSANTLSWCGASLLHALHPDTLSYVPCVHRYDAKHSIDTINKKPSDMLQRCECDEVGQMIDLYRHTNSIVQY